MKSVFRNNKGINLISLTLTVIVILMLTSVILYNVKDNLGVQNLKNMQTDIANLRDKVSTYYAQYGDIPLENEYTAIENLEEAGIISDAVDTGEFYVIDLSAIENLTLTYGREYEKIKSRKATTPEKINALQNIYIINKDSHNIFYVKGITLDGETFYTDYTTKDVDEVEVSEIQITEESEIWSPAYDITATYKDKNGDIVKIPEGFQVSRTPGQNTVREGLVVRDADGNQYTWIIVDKEITEVPDGVTVEEADKEEFLSSCNTFKGYYKNNNDNTVYYLTET